MKKLVLFVIVVLSFTSIFGQTEDNDFVADTIVRLGGKKMIVDVTQVTTSYISYLVPGETESKKVEIKQIEKILYNDGGIEIFNKPIFSMVDETDWKSIWVTENAEEVQGLYEIEEIEAISSPSSRNKKAAKNSATIRLQKKTANKGGNVVLILHQESRGGYGEMPGYYIKGMTYSFEPPKKDSKTTE